MTISTTTTTITYSGNASTTVFTFPFVGAAAADISVVYTDANGTITTLSPSLYTLTFNTIPAGGLWAIGGSVTYPTVGSPIAVGTFLAITRNVPYTQSVSIANQSNFYPQSVETGLDLIEMQLQQSQTGVTYSLKTPTSDSVPPNNLPAAAARANGYLSFDATGQPIVTTGTSSANPSSTAPARKISTTGTATINILTSDSFGGVSIYQSSTPVTTLQLPASGGPYPIFDGSGNASTANITVLPPAGKTIDGNSSYVLNSNYQAVTVYWDGTQYLIAAGSQGLGSSISVAGSITAGTTINAGTSVNATTSVNASTSVNATTAVTAGTTVSDGLGNVRNIPYNPQSAAYVLLATDNGKLVEQTTTGGVTVNNSVFSAGNNVAILNTTGGSITVVQGSGVTMYLVGSGSTGNRTLANFGEAFIFFRGASTCVISGTGLT